MNENDKLTRAIENNDMELFQQCITTEGADLEEALLLASKLGRKEMVQTLVDKGADLRHSNYRNDLDYNIGEEGEKAIHLAAEYGHTEIIEILAKGGANLDAIANKTGNGDRNVTPLHLAVMENHKEVVKVLIRYGADVHIQGGKKNNRLPLQLAADLGFEDIAQILIEQGGANVNLGDDDYGQKPLEIAIWHGHANLAKMFLNYGTNIDDAKNLYEVSRLSLAFREHGEQYITDVLPMLGFHYFKNPRDQDEVQKILINRDLGKSFKKGEQVRTHIRDNLPLLNGLLVACREQNFDKIVQIEDEILADGSNQKKFLAELKNLDKYLNENNFSIGAKNLLGSAAQKEYIAGVTTSLMKGREDVASVASTFLEALKNIETFTGKETAGTQSCNR